MIDVECRLSRCVVHLGANVNQPLEVLDDVQGAVVLGWVGPRVFYIRYVGDISARLGIAGASRLRLMLAEHRDILCFVDAASPETIDFSARSAMVRAFYASRTRFSHILTLTRASVVASTARVVAAMTGDITTIVDDTQVFKSELLKVAPFALPKLRPETFRRCNMSDLQEQWLAKK